MIHQNPPAAGGIEPRQELHQGALAAAALAHHANEGAWFDVEVDGAEHLRSAWHKGEAHVFKHHVALDRRQGDVAFIGRIGFFRCIHHIGEPLKRHPQLLDGLPDGGKPQQGLGDIAADDAEGNQLSQGEFAFEHHGSSHPKHQQLRELLQHLTGFIQEGACDGFIEGAGDVFGVEVLPLPAAHHLHVLRLHGLNAADHLHQVALGARILFCSLAVLAAKQRRAQESHRNLDGQHRQGDQGEHPAVDHHHDDVDHREGCI